MQKRRLLDSKRPKSKKLRKSTLRRKFRPPSAASKPNITLDATPPLSPRKNVTDNSTEGVIKVQDQPAAEEGNVEPVSSNIERQLDATQDSHSQHLNSESLDHGTTGSDDSIDDATAGLQYTDEAGSKSCMLVPLDIDMTSFQGFVTVHGHRYQIFLRGLPSQLPMAKKKARDAAFEFLDFGCDKSLMQVLGAVSDVVSLRLRRCRSLEELHVELANIIEQGLRRCPPRKCPPSSYYSKIMKQMDEVGWHRLVDLDDSAACITLKQEDERGRSHNIAITLPPKYPDGQFPPKLSVALPLSSASASSRQELVLPSLVPGSTLKQILHLFEIELKRYQVFWDTMDELDSDCWVLGPEKPSRAHTWRRLAVAKHCSMLVEVDPLAPRALCESRFLGTTHEVTKLQQRLNARVFQWDESNKTLLENLQHVLQIEFPSPVSSKKSDFTVMCSICYAYRLVKTRDQPTKDKDSDIKRKADAKTGPDSTSYVDAEESIPDQICDNPKCAKAFHTECLYEWISSLASTHKSFNTLFGKCPYCSHPISVDTMCLS